LVNGHDLDNATGRRAGLAFAAATVLQGSGKDQKVSDIDQFAGVNVGQEFGNVAQSPGLARQSQRGQVIGLVQE
jgi:hypothetical protein